MTERADKYTLDEEQPSGIQSISAVQEGKYYTVTDSIEIPEWLNKLGVTVGTSLRVGEKREGSDLLPVSFHKEPSHPDQVRKVVAFLIHDEVLATLNVTESKR
ncbi:hypothetical protein GF340_06240 [Candidatus Peregrinibacteria bacterium]|nr:hypothetical protein [Candidatus Peregrinibacteria bacterium]